MLPRSHQPVQAAQLASMRTSKASRFTPPYAQLSAGLWMRRPHAFSGPYARNTSTFTAEPHETSVSTRRIRL